VPGKTKHKQRAREDQASLESARPEAGAGPPPKMKRKEYERHMRVLHGELVAMQEWVKATGAKICVVFEGRDTAGKGGTIRRITERVSPRVFRVVALPAPTEREKSQMYVQRYLPHFPAAGEVVIFDRSWYNRAGVEPVMGFCTPEQTRRLKSRMNDLNIITHLLSQVPYQPPAPATSPCPGASPPTATSSPTCPCTTSRHRSKQIDGLRAQSRCRSTARSIASAREATPSFW
jgi:polyphosphate kinase 2 (PPK2 family)